MLILVVKVKYVEENLGNVVNFPLTNLTSIKIKNFTVRILIFYEWLKIPLQLRLTSHHSKVAYQIVQG